MNGPDPQLLARFLELARERLRTLNQALLEVERGDADASRVDEAMREIHTLKGESKMLGLGAVNRVAHRTEDLLLKAKRERAFQDDALLGAAYDGFDLLGELLDAEPEAMRDATEARAAAFAERVDALAPGTKQNEPEPIAVSAPSGDPPAPAAAPEEPGAPPAERSAAVSTVRVPTDTIDEVTRASGEVGSLQMRIRQFAAQLSRMNDAQIDRCAELLADEEARNGSSESLRAARLRALRDAGNDFDALLRSMREACFSSSLRQQRLQSAVESMRLTEVASLFGRFPRMVRDLARELDKEARVRIEGQHVGADQQVLNALADPLVHLVRNSVDHGLEPPEVRLAAGKPRIGTILLEARQAGRFVDIVVGDDGRGLDPRAIGDAAVRRGLLSDADVAGMSDQDLLEQLFRPAFSTKREVSDVSGRGVGLDVVKSTVQALGGSIRIEGKPGSGTRFVLRLPVSIAVMDALVLDLAEGLYAIPSAYVDRAITVRAQELESAAGGTSVKLADGSRVPVLDLAGLLGFDPLPGADDGEVRLVVVVDNVRRLALRVPRFVGELSLVQESLSAFVRGLRVATGTAVLEGGRRVVLLNVIELFELASGRVAAPRGAAAQEAPAQILVVEDSDLTRSMVVAALTRAGYRVVEAVNGAEGLEQAAVRTPDLVVTDLEMPRLDGVAMMRRLRADERFRTVPIVVFTTVDPDAARAKATEAGADAYVTKSEFDEDAFLGLVQRLLAGRTA